MGCVSGAKTCGIFLIKILECGNFCNAVCISSTSRLHSQLNKCLKIRISNLDSSNILLSLNFRNCHKVDKKNPMKTGQENLNSGDVVCQSSLNYS